MSGRIFKTSEILAEMHSFPFLIAAREGRDILDVFDELRTVSTRMAGGEGLKADHESWCKLNQAMRPLLKEIFPGMAREMFPDASYWSNPGKTIDAEKALRLGAWVKAMENRFGETQEMIDISEEVSRRMQIQELLDSCKEPPPRMEI